jgi:3-carboxy-cis,cis-muconate cycloisomerase
MRQVASGLAVDAGRMRTNLDITHGLIMGEAVMLALGGKMGRMVAHKLVEEASREAAASGRHLREVLGDRQDVASCLSPQELDRLFEPANYSGEAGAFVDRVLKSHQRWQDQQQHHRRDAAHHQEKHA